MRWCRSAQQVSWTSFLAQEAHDWQDWARSALMFDFGLWQGRLSPVIRRHHRYQAGDRRK